MWRAVLCCGVVAGCTDEGGGSARPDGVAASDGYALLRDAQWVLREAVDPPAGDPAASAQRPPVEWYVEYERAPSGLESQLVVISGHEPELEETRSQLAASTFELAETPVDGWPAVGGVSGDPVGPGILVLDDGDRSIMVLSYELSVDQLASLAARIETVDSATWTAAGGIIR